LLIASANIPNTREVSTIFLFNRLKN
jgi:hypothetical protein